MQFTQRGATTLWRLVQRAKGELGNFALLFLEDGNEGLTTDQRGVTYWKGVAAFLREWADKLDEFAKSLDDKGTPKQT